MYSQYKKNIIDFLSDKKVTIAILVLVILSRVIQLIYFYNIVVDASYQIMGAQNFLAGHGISLSHVSPENLSKNIYTPLINWPPGYSILFAPFFYLFDFNYMAAGIAIDIIFAIYLILICRKILSLLQVPLYQLNIFTLLTGFFIYFFYFNASSDGIAITLLLTGLYFSLKIIKSNYFSLRNLAGLIFFLFAAAFIKYLFMPIVFIIPAYMILYGIINKLKSIKKTGILSFFILLLLIAGILIYQKLMAGTAAYISSTGRGFFPENILLAYPTFPASFIKPDSIALLTTQPEQIKNIIYIVFQFIYIVFLSFCILYLIRKLLQTRLRFLSGNEHFLYLSFTITFFIIAELFILSLFVEKETIFEWRLWTYVEEARYYGLPNVLMHLCVFIVFKILYEKNKKKAKLFLLFFLILMIPEMVRGIYFDVNRIKNFKKEEYSWQYENRIQKYADSIINLERKRLGINSIVIAGTSYNINHRVMINSKASLLPAISALNTSSILYTNSSVILLVILEKPSLPSLQPFLSNPSLRYSGQFEDYYYFYTLPIYSK